MAKQHNVTKMGFTHITAGVKDPKNEKGKYIVSTLGYQSTEEKIKAMTMAGINLALIRGQFQMEAADVEDKKQALKPDNLARSKRMDLQDKLEIARETRQKLADYKAKLDHEQKKALRERQEYLERMTAEYEGIIKAKDKETPKNTIQGDS